MIWYAVVFHCKREVCIETADEISARIGIEHATNGVFLL